MLSSRRESKRRKMAYGIERVALPYAHGCRGNLESVWIDGVLFGQVTCLDRPLLEPQKLRLPSPQLLGLSHSCRQKIQELPLGLRSSSARNERRERPRVTSRGDIHAARRKTSSRTWRVWCRWSLTQPRKMMTERMVAMKYMHSTVLEYRINEALQQLARSPLACSTHCKYHPCTLGSRT